MNKQPEVTARTRRHIMDCFWELYFENGIDKVTVGSVMKKAEMNRGTFYQYFTDIHDILNQYEDELMDNILSLALSKFNKDIPMNAENLSEITLEILEFYDDKLGFLLSDKGDAAFAEKFKKRFIPIAININQIPPEIAENDYIISALFFSAIGSVKKWYQKGKEIPLKDLIIIIQKFIKFGLFGFINNQ